MNESFFGLNIAVNGLYSAQRSLDVVNHNISNVNTPGYSRQQVVQVASKPMALYDGTGMMGTGSEVTGITRVRDEYLDFKYWSENRTSGEWDTKSTQLTNVEAIFNEPSDSGFNKIMGDFYNSLHELAKDPSSPANRAIVQQKGVTLAKYFNSTAANFEKMQADVNDCVRIDVDHVNSMADQIQQLNRQIYTSELDGSTASDLRDQRTVLVDQLSKLVNIDANEVVVGKLPSGLDDKHFVITISGKALVDHFQVSKLALAPRTSQLNADDSPNLYDVKWADGNSLNIKGGELRGYLDIRDGNNGKVGLDGVTATPMYKGIPYYMNKMDQFARTFAKDFNNIHSAGYGYNDTAGGTDFFTILGSDDNPISTYDFSKMTYNDMTAANISVSGDIMNDSNKIATSDSNTNQVGNINTLNKLLDTRTDDNMFSEGAPEDFMKSLVSTLGVDSQQAKIFSNIQGSVINQVTNQRSSVSGVSIDEEMANLIKYQQAYNASARMINTMAEVYDTLINKLFV
ncbi:MAG: flagellar hook-associated protein FlgK [Bacillota bacterium]|nr:flagellar hook-associated protein FlgK [Bacillota bacterium]